MRAALLLLVGCKSAMPLDGHAWVSRDRTTQVIKSEREIYALHAGQTIPLAGDCMPKEVDSIEILGDRVLALDWHMTGSIYHSTGAVLDTACMFDLKTRKFESFDDVFPGVQLPDRTSNTTFLVGERTGWIYGHATIYDVPTKAQHPIPELARDGCDVVETDGKARIACVEYRDQQPRVVVLTLSTAAFPPTENARDVIALDDAKQLRLSRDAARLALWSSSDAAPRSGVIVDLATSRRHPIPVAIRALDFDVAGAQLAVVLQPDSTRDGDIVVFDLGASGLTERKRIHVATDAPLDEFAWLADGTFRIGSDTASRVVR